jgi:hypothetical protein
MGHFPGSSQLAKNATVNSLGPFTDHDIAFVIDVFSHHNLNPFRINCIDWREESKVLKRRKQGVRVPVYRSETWKSLDEIRNS